MDDVRLTADSQCRDQFEMLPTDSHAHTLRTRLEPAAVRENMGQGGEEVGDDFRESNAADS